MFPLPTGVYNVFPALLNFQLKDICFSFIVRGRIKVKWDPSNGLTSKSEFIRLFHFIIKESLL